MTRCVVLILLASVVFGTTCADDDSSTDGQEPVFRVHTDAVELVSRLEATPMVLAERAPTVLAAVVTSRDRIVTASANGVVGWVDPHKDATGVLVESPHEFGAAALSSDGRLLASTDLLGELTLFDIPAGQTILRDAESRTVSVALSADDSTLVSVSAEGTARTWNTRNGKLRDTVEITATPLPIVALSTDGAILAHVASTNAIEVVDLVGNSDRRIAVADTRVCSLAFLTGDMLAVGYGDGRTQLHDLTGEQPAKVIGRQTFAVWRLAFDQQFNRLATASWDGTIKLWNLSSGDLLGSYKGHEESPAMLAFDRRGGLVSAGLDGKLLYWQPGLPSVRSQAAITGHPEQAWVGLYSPDGSRLFVGGKANRFEMWDVASGKLLYSREAHPTTRCAAFSKNGSLLVTGGDDRDVVLWDVTTGERQATLPGHRGLVSAVVVSGDGKTLFSVCDGRSVRRWDIETGNETGHWRQHDQQIYCANISPDGRWLITGGGNWTSDDPGELVVWDSRTGEVRKKWNAHRLAIWTIAISPDGRHFATSSSSGNVKVWNLETLELVRTLEHNTWVRPMAFARDGKTLAVGRGDGSIRLWDTRTWRQTASLDEHSNFTFFVDFAPDGKRLATAGNDGTVRFWPAPPY